MATKEELQKEQAELKAELDELKTRLAEADAKYRAYNQKLQQEGLSESQKQEYKEERTDAKEQQAELRQRRDPLLARLTEIEKLLNPPPVPAVSHNEEAFLVPVPMNAKDVKGFMQAQLMVEVSEAKLPEGNTISKRMKRESTDRIVNLVEALGGFEGGRTKIYVRDCMIDIVESILNYFKGRELKWLVLGGTRGCGKSVVGSVVALLLSAQGTVVLYQHHGETMLMISENVSEADLAELNEMLIGLKAPPLSRTTQVWEVAINKADMFIHKFKVNSNFVFVQDLGDQKYAQIPDQNGNGKRLIVTSPNAKKIRHLDRTSLTRLVLMPTWEWHEILQLKEAKVDDKERKANFDLVGGIPRWVVDAAPGETEMRLNKQIENLNSDVLDIVFSTRGYFGLPSMLDKDNDDKSVDLIFQIKPTSLLDKSLAKDQEFKVVLTSDEVGERLIEDFAARSEDEILKFVSVIEKHDRLGELRGNVLEGAVHRSFGEHGAFKTMSVFKIEYAPKKKKQQGLQPLFVDQSVMRFVKQAPFKRIEDLSVEQGVYYYARRKNEATIDSFAVVEEGFVRMHFPGHPELNPSKKSTPSASAGGKRLFVVFFQITIAKSHTMNGSLLHKHQAKIREKLHLSELPMLIVWISWSEGIKTWQTVTQGGDEKKPFKDQGQFGPQYVLQLRGRFDELARKYPVGASHKGD